MRFHYGDQSGGWWRKPAASPLHGELVAASSKGSVYGPIYLVRTPNSRSVFRAGVSVNNHSFINVYGSSHRVAHAAQDVEHWLEQEIASWVHHEDLI